MGSFPSHYPEVTSNFLVLHVEVMYDLINFLRINRSFYSLITSPTTVQHLCHVNKLTRKDIPLTTFHSFLFHYVTRWYPELSPVLPPQLLQLMITNDDADGFDMLDISVDLPKDKLVSKLMYHKCHKTLRKCIPHYKEIEQDIPTTINRLYKPATESGIFCFSEWDHTAAKYLFFNNLIPGGITPYHVLGVTFHLCRVELLLLQEAPTNKVIEILLPKDYEYANLIIKYDREDLVEHAGAHYGFDTPALLSAPKVAKRCLELKIVSEERLHSLSQPMSRNPKMVRREKRTTTAVSWKALELIQHLLTQEDIWNLANQAVEVSDPQTLDWLLSKLTTPYQNNYGDKMATVKTVLRKWRVIDQPPYEKRNILTGIGSLLNLLVSSNPYANRYRSPLILSSSSSSDD